jgi:DNA (cytosine-5)-methyltransferase 1
MAELRFIDLFAGLGGFHQALASLGHRCVFASELDPGLAKLYQQNFEIGPAGDIRQTYLKVPPHDILCAGFPCQPFSKAGEQLGFDCPQWGDLFDYVIRILERHQPTYLVIENVPNLMRHDGGGTWRRIEDRLRSIGYAIASRKLSPHMFGVPQIRERAIIVGARQGLDGFAWPQPTHHPDELDIRSVLDREPADAKPLPSAFIGYLEAWQALLNALPAEADLPSFPIWAMEFRADYPILSSTPVRKGLSTIGACRGAFGEPLGGLSDAEVLRRLPPYARDPESVSPIGRLSSFCRTARFIGDTIRSSIRGCHRFGHSPPVFKS